MTEKMEVQVSGGINWSWYKVRNGKLVAIFRLHYGEDQIEAFHKLMKKMKRVEEIAVPFATWLEKCDLIADHTGKTDGYALPEVTEAFGWLDDMFSKTADDHEGKHCADGTMRHLEYHGVAVCRL